MEEPTQQAQTSSAYCDDQVIRRAPRNTAQGADHGLLKNALAKEKAAIEEETNIGDDINNDLFKVIERLESRLAPILSNIPETDQKESDRGRTGSSQLYEALFQTNNLNITATARLRRLISRIEV